MNPDEQRRMWLRAIRFLMKHKKPINHEQEYRLEVSE